MTQVVKIPEATPLELLEYLMENYSKEWLDWEPETMWSEIDCGRQCIFNRNKINALSTLLSNDTFWKDWIAFEKVVLALNNVPPRFDVIEEPSPAQMAYAVRIAEEVRSFPGANTPGKDPAYSSEVKYYIAVRALLEGIVYLPPPLEFAQSKLDELTGMKRLAEAIKRAANDPKHKIDEEDPVSIGAARTRIIKHYAYSNDRKALD